MKFSKRRSGLSPTSDKDNLHKKKKDIWGSGPQVGQVARLAVIEK